jgi:hypothetical protein
MRSVKQPAALPLLALTAWLSMPAYAANGEFAVGQDFLSAEPAQTRTLPGADLQAIQHLPAKTLSELMAAARGQLPLDRKAPPVPLVVNPHKPLVYVAGPKTGGELTPVVLADEMKAREAEEAEILREAEEALKMDLPLEADVSPRPLAQNTPAAPAKHPVVPKERPASIAGLSLELADVGHELRITPKTLQMSMQGDGITVVDKNLRGSPQIFLRNSKIVRWDAARKKLDARDTGRTELYVTYRDQLYIVPIEVSGGAEHRDPLLVSEGPASFQKLTSILPLMEQPYASYGDAPAHPLAAPELPADRPEETRQPLTLATSVAQVEATRERVSEQQARFFYPDANQDYRTLDIQVLDERSLPENAVIFPVSGVSVRVLGTRLKAKTSADGHAKFGEIPEGSRFFVEIQDENNGQIVPTISEVALYRNGRDQVLRTRTMNYRSYSHYLNILDIAQDAKKASLCARAMSEDGRQPLAGYQVALNVEADGPFYVSQLGWPQPGLHETDATGRFCFFNVKPGLVELTFETEGERTALSMPVFAGAHSEEDLPLRNSNGRIFLAAMPNAVDQIYEERQALEQPLQPIDYVDMVAVGENQNMARVGDAVLGYEGGTTLFKGRLYTVAQAPEFETALYTFDRDKQVRRSLPVAPLLQRGYIQDVFHELAVQDNHASIAFDAALGSVVVLHRLESGMGTVNVSLVDNLGRVYNQGWSFGNPDQGLSRTVFFNMNPGVYSVIVENQQGAILSLDTIAVDFWTASVVQTGSTAHYNLQQARRED